MQQITELEQKKMEVLEEVAKANVTLAEVRAEIKNLEEGKEKFYAFRENEVLGRIHKLLNESRILLDETNSNYTYVHAFYEEIERFSGILFEATEMFEKNVSDFTENSEKWNKEIERQEKAIIKWHESLKRESEGIDRDKKFIAKKQEEMEKTRRHIESQQQTVKTSIEQLRKIWEKIPEAHRQGIKI